MLALVLLTVTKPVRVGLMTIAWMNFWQSLTACKGTFIQGSRDVLSMP